MKGNMLTKLVRKAALQASKNAPAILTGLAIAGVAVTVISAIKATREASDIVDDYSEMAKEIDEKTKDEDPQVKREMMKKMLINAAKELAPIYAPVIISGVLTMVCIFGAQRINYRRQAALAALYNVADTTLKTYQEKAKAVIGPKKELSIRDDVAKDVLDAHPVANYMVYDTGKGTVLCFDEMSGRYFRSNPDYIQKVENKLNERLFTEMSITLNELYSELNLPRIKLGDVIGWNVNDGLIKISRSSHLNENDEPALVLKYDVSPRFDFGKLS